MQNDSFTVFLIDLRHKMRKTVNGKPTSTVPFSVFTMCDLYLAIVVLHIYSLQIVYGSGMGVWVNLLTNRKY